MEEKMKIERKEKEGKWQETIVCPKCQGTAHVNELYPEHTKIRCDYLKNLYLRLKGIKHLKPSLKNAIKNLNKKKYKLSRHIAKNQRSSVKPFWFHWDLEDEEHRLHSKAYRLVKLKERVQNESK